MSKPWFDAKTGELLLHEYICEMPSFKDVLADNVITDEEIADQSKKVRMLLQRLEKTLPPETKDLVTETLCELGVLSLLQHRRSENLA